MNTWLLVLVWAFIIYVGIAGIVYLYYRDKDQWRAIYAVLAPLWPVILLGSIVELWDKLRGTGDEDE